MTDSVQHQRQLTFNEDGTIDPSQLEGMDQATIDRLTAPDFVAMARQQIAANKARESFRRGAAQIKAQARQEHEMRRPTGISGRQRRLLRKACRKNRVLA